MGIVCVEPVENLSTEHNPSPSPTRRKARIARVLGLTTILSCLPAVSLSTDSELHVPPKSKVATTVFPVIDHGPLVNVKRTPIPAPCQVLATQTSEHRNQGKRVFTAGPGNDWQDPAAACLSNLGRVCSGIRVASGDELCADLDRAEVFYNEGSAHVVVQVSVGVERGHFYGYSLETPHDTCQAALDDVDALVRAQLAPYPVFELATVSTVGLTTACLDDVERDRLNASFG